MKHTSTTLIRRFAACAMLTLLSFSFTCAKSKVRPQIIAHRGYWTCLGEKTQNSRAANIAAFSHQFYGSETDVWLSTDGDLMVNHDPHLGGVTLQDATTATCQSVLLSNGENMPKLRALLQLLQASQTPTKLIIEVKGHKNDALNMAAAKAAVALVKDMQMQERVEYISFSLIVCRTLVEEDASAKVAYLSGDLTPQEVHSMGLTGIDYQYPVIEKHPEWVEECHRLGMTVNIWTVDEEQKVEQCCKWGADYITTNYPEMADKVTKR